MATKPSNMSGNAFLRNEGSGYQGRWFRCRYKQSIAEIFPSSSFEKSSSLNYDLAKVGLARYYSNYPPESERLQRLYEGTETKPKESKTELWKEMVLWLLGIGEGSNPCQFERV